VLFSQPPPNILSASALPPLIRFFPLAPKNIFNVPFVRLLVEFSTSSPRSTTSLILFLIYSMCSTLSPRRLLPFSQLSGLSVFLFLLEGILPSPSDVHKMITRLAYTSLFQSFPKPPPFYCWSSLPLVGFRLGPLSRIFFHLYTALVKNILSGNQVRISLSFISLPSPFFFNSPRFIFPHVFW